MPNVSRSNLFVWWQNGLVCGSTLFAPGWAGGLFDLSRNALLASKVKQCLFPEATKCFSFTVKCQTYQEATFLSDGKMGLSVVAPFSPTPPPNPTFPPWFLLWLHLLLLAAVSWEYPLVGLDRFSGWLPCWYRVFWRLPSLDVNGLRIRSSWWVVLGALGLRSSAWILGWSSSCGLLMQPTLTPSPSFLGARSWPSALAIFVDSPRCLSWFSQR